MSDMMTFPDTVEEFMENYKIVDTDEVYTNGAELVPIFRMKQWFEHLPSAQPEYRLDEWCTDCKEYDTERHCCPRFNQVIRTTLNEMKSERKKGKWKTALLDHEAFGVRPKVLYCSECNQCIAYPTRYCPNCGADMRGE